MIEKRAHARKTLKTQAWMSDSSSEEWREISLLDLSVSGAAFAVNRELATGTSHLFRFSLPQQTKRIVFTAEVMNCMPHIFLGGFRIGVKIARIDAEDQNSITAFIEAASPV